MKKVEKIVVYLLMFMLCICASKLTAAADEPGEAVELTVYVKNSANWEVINVYAWDNHDGAATDMEWVETPMDDMGNGWRSYTLTGFNLDFFFCFQDGGSAWTNDVPVEPGMTEVYLELKDETKGEKQVCQYTEERPGEEEPASEPSSDSASDDSSSEQAGEEAEVIPVEAEKTSGISMVIPIIIVIVVVALVAAGICVYRVKGKKNK